MLSAVFVFGGVLMHSKKITVRFASAISAAVIGFTSTAISFFDSPVYAAYGGAAWGEFFGFYSLLEGFGFGQDNTDFINSVDNWIDSLKPEEKPREDYDGEWMTDAQYWQQCQYDKFTGWLDNLVDSWSESYDAVGDVGSGGASGGSAFGQLSDDGTCYRVSFPSSDYHISNSSHSIWFLLWSDDSRPVPDSVIVNFINLRGKLCVFCTSDSYAAWQSSKIKGIKFASDPDGNFGMILQKLVSSPVSGFSYYYAYSEYSVDFWSDYFSLFRDNGIDIAQFDGGIADYLKSFSDVKFSISDDFIGPVYTYPAAQELARQNKTSTGIRLDVKTADGAPDVKAALDGAGVSTVDELAASVAAGNVAMQDVFTDAKVTPYVVADTTTGVVVTDLGVAADAAGVKPVALTKELTVPADLTNAATYAIQGKTWDPDMARYRLPLFQYFPFCLPWDIYQVLSSFAADPVAPQIEIPIGKFFANKKSFDGSAVANYTETLNLGDEKFSKWFSVLRLLESAGIIIGLVLISVHLIHGGR